LKTILFFFFFLSFFFFFFFLGGGGLCKFENITTVPDHEYAIGNFQAVQSAVRKASSSLNIVLPLQNSNKV
jgi:hypothetical protein